MTFFLIDIATRLRRGSNPIQSGNGCKGFFIPRIWIENGRPVHVNSRIRSGNGSKRKRAMSCLKFKTEVFHRFYFQGTLIYEKIYSPFGNQFVDLTH